MNKEKQENSMKEFTITLSNFLFRPSHIEFDGECRIVIKVSENRQDFSSRIYDEEERIFYLSIEELDYDFPPLKHGDNSIYSITSPGKFSISVTNYNRIKPCVILIQSSPNNCKTNSYVTEGDKSTVIDFSNILLLNNKKEKEQYSYFKEISETFILKPNKVIEDKVLDLKESFDQFCDDESLPEFNYSRDNLENKDIDQEFPSKENILTYSPVPEYKDVEEEIKICKFDSDLKAALNTKLPIILKNVEFPKINQKFESLSIQLKFKEFSRKKAKNFLNESSFKFYSGFILSLFNE